MRTTGSLGCQQFVCCTDDYLIQSVEVRMKVDFGILLLEEAFQIELAICKLLLNEQLLSVVALGLLILVLSDDYH